MTQAGSGAFTYAYDANGNATRNGQTVSRNRYNYPSYISNSATETVTLYYDADMARWKQSYVNSGTTETTYYVDGMMEKATTGGTSDYRYYIYASGRTAVAVMSRLSTGSNTTRYILEDHQDSVARITDGSGNVTVSESFTAFGSRRSPSTWSGSPSGSDLTTIAGITRQGYTWQTALGNMGLNHMNGRVQDAVTGRFLSADPYIPDPMNTQNYNRYNYVRNNPLSLIDPSGFYDLPEVVIIAYRTYGSSGGGQSTPNDDVIVLGAGVPGAAMAEAIRANNKPLTEVASMEGQNLVQCMKEAAAGGGSGVAGDFGQNLANLGQAHMAFEGSIERLTGASALSVGRALGSGPGITSPTNAAFAQNGTQVQSALRQASPYIKGVGTTLGLISIGNEVVEGYAFGGCKELQ